MTEEPIQEGVSRNKASQTQQSSSLVWEQNSEMEAPTKKKANESGTTAQSNGDNQALE